MLREYVHGKVGVFIDAANILYSQHTLKWRLDYTKLLQYLRGEMKITVLRYYTGKVGTLEKQLAFIKKLESIGYAVVAKEVKFIKLNDGRLMPKGNLDVELALDVYRQADQFDTLLLFSGDSDFAYLLDLLKQQGKKVVVISTRGHVSKELLDRAKYIDLRKLREFIEKNQEPRWREALDVWLFKYSQAKNNVKLLYSSSTYENLTLLIY